MQHFHPLSIGMFLQGTISGGSNSPKLILVKNNLVADCSTSSLVTLPDFRRGPSKAYLLFFPNEVSSKSHPAFKQAEINYIKYWMCICFEFFSNKQLKNKTTFLNKINNCYHKSFCLYLLQVYYSRSHPVFKQAENNFVLNN